MYHSLLKLQFNACKDKGSYRIHQANCPKNNKKIDKSSKFVKKIV